MILDGRDRYTAAKAVRHKFTRQLRSVGRHLAEAEAWVISTNFHRRQLTTKQKQEMIEGMIRRNPDLSDREIARQIGVSNSTVGAARDSSTLPKCSAIENSRRNGSGFPMLNVRCSFAII